jgi:hypothetical protein
LVVISRYSRPVRRGVRPLTGSIDKFADNSDLLTDPRLWRSGLPLVE